MKTLSSLPLQSAALGAILSLAGCNLADVREVRSGTENPVETGPEAAGASLARYYSHGQGWSGAARIETGPELPSRTSAYLEPLRTRTPLGKGAASTASLEFTIDLSDTADGIARLYHVHRGRLLTRHDTVVVRWDERARDDVRDNENIVRAVSHTVHNGGKEERAEFTDADGDGIIGPLPGAPNKVRVAFSSRQGAVGETATAVVDAGSDGDFDTEPDNNVYLAEWSRTRNGSLTAEAEYADADGDGLVVNHAVASSLVDVTYFEIEPAGKPLVQEVRALARVRVLANQAGEEPVSFEAEETLKNGRVNSIRMENDAGGSEIIAGDTLKVFVQSVSRDDNDTLKSLLAVFTVNPGQDLRDEADDSLYAFSIYAEKNRGIERTGEFHFTSDRPVLHGRDAESGSFEMSVTYADGRSAELEGSFSPRGFAAVYTGPHGDRKTLTVTLSGEVVEKEPAI